MVSYYKVILYGPFLMYHIKNYITNGEICGIKYCGRSPCIYDGYKGDID